MAAISRSDPNEESSSDAPMCEVCLRELSKYCCPNIACSKLTCSLACCKQHKADSGCNGKRNKTAFKALTDYEEKDLQSDFHLLEHVAIGVDRAKRSRSRDIFCGKKWSAQKQVKRRMACDEPEENVEIDVLSASTKRSGLCKKLVSGATQHNVILQLMPQGMSRRDRNTSKFNGKIIQWLIQFDFHLENDTIQTVFAEQVSHDKLWIDIVKKHCFDQGAELKHILRQFSQRVCESDGSDRGFCFLMRKEPCPANDISYYQFDPCSAVKACLSHKTVIEFPVISVVLLEHLPKFKLQPDLITLLS